MSSVLPKSFIDEVRSSVAHRVAESPWLREPLLHFVVLGAMLFAADQLLVARTDDPRTIVVDAAVDAQAIDVFKKARGREPNGKELYALRRVWLDNEVLYREGLALGVDKGDSAIRERVIFKMLSVVDAGTRLPPIDDKQLRDWFEKNRVKYDEPARYDFQEAVLSGERSDPAVRALVDTLRKGTPGDLNAGLRVFKGRPHSNIVQGYGEEFAKALEGARPGEWVALPTKDGLRAVLLDSVTPAKPADFDSLRAAVLQDWTDATAAEQRSAAVAVLAKKYTVKYDEAAK